MDKCILNNAYVQFDHAFFFKTNYNVHVSFGMHITKPSFEKKNWRIKYFTVSNPYLDKSSFRYDSSYRSTLCFCVMRCIRWQLRLHLFYRIHHEKVWQFIEVDSARRWPFNQKTDYYIFLLSVRRQHENGIYNMVTTYIMCKSGEISMRANSWIHNIRLVCIYRSGKYFYLSHHSICDSIIDLET